MGIFSYLGEKLAERNAKKLAEQRIRVDALKQEMKPQFTQTPLEKAEELALEAARKARNCPPKPKVTDEDVSEAWDKFGKKHIKTVTRDDTLYELEKACITGGVSVEPDKSRELLSKAGLKAGMDVTACYDKEKFIDGDFKAAVSGGGVTVKADLEKNLTLEQTATKGTKAKMGDEGVELEQEMQLFRAETKVSSGVNEDGGVRMGAEGEVAVADAKLKGAGKFVRNPDCTTTYELSGNLDVTDKTKSQKNKDLPDLVNQHINTEVSGKVRATPVERTSLSPEYGHDKPGEISPRTKHRTTLDYNDMKHDPDCKQGMKGMRKEDIAAPIESRMKLQGKTYNDALKETKEVICDKHENNVPMPQVIKKPRVYEGIEL